jgi:hypothetical protein
MSTVDFGVDVSADRIAHHALLFGEIALDHLLHRSSRSPKGASLELDGAPRRGCRMFPVSPPRGQVRPRAFFAYQRNIHRLSVI